MLSERQVLSIHDSTRKETAMFATAIIEPYCAKAGEPTAAIPVTIDHSQEEDIFITWDVQGVTKGSVLLTWLPDGLPRIALDCACRAPGGAMIAAKYIMQKFPGADKSDVTYVILLRGDGHGDGHPSATLSSREKGCK
jgi:hypothetical protein